MKKILVVEDQDEVRFTVVSALKILGYEVIEANHGGAALTLIDAGLKPDLVLTDINMTVLNGPGLAEQLALRRYPGKIVFMSGGLGKYSHDDLVKHSPYYMDKPITVEKIKETLDRALSEPPPLTAA